MSIKALWSCGSCSTLNPMEADKCGNCGVKGNPKLDMEAALHRKDGDVGAAWSDLEKLSGSLGEEQRALIQSAATVYARACMHAAFEVRPDGTPKSTIFYNQG